MEWFGPFEPCCSGLHSKSPNKNQAFLLEVVAWGLSSSRIASRCWTCGLLWRAWCAWAHCGHCGFTGRLGSHQGVKLTVVRIQFPVWNGSRWKMIKKFLIFFWVHLVFVFFSRDFWMISWSWSWCQVLVKDSALHKSCLRGKLLLFDPTSSLHPCRTVRIKRPELQFSFCWFLVFDLSTLSCFANGFWNPSNVLWIPLDLRFQQVFSVLSLWFQALRVRCVQATELCRMCTQRWCPSNASDLCDRIAAGGSECFGLLQGSKHRYLGGLFSDSHDMIWVLQVCD